MRDRHASEVENVPADTDPIAEWRRAQQGAVPAPPLSSRRLTALAVLCVALPVAVVALAAGGAGYAAVLAASCLSLATAAGAALALAKSVRRHRQVESALGDSLRRYRRFFESTPAGIYRSSVDGRFFECNPALVRLLRYDSVEELLRADAASLYFDPAERQRFIARLKTAGQLDESEFRLRRKDGSPVWILENVTWRGAQDGEPDSIEGTLIDITGRKAAESGIAYQAYHDGLTGLPNRALFLDRLAQSLAKARRTDTGVAVLMLDVDRFKTVNDVHGHDLGDRLLRTAAERLRAMVRQGDTAARFGGDQFTVLLQYDAGADDAAKVAQNLLERLAEPFLLDERPLRVTASAGISLYPADGADADSLLRSADLARRRAKELGGNCYELCTAAMNARAVARLALDADLRRALERQELELVYQPVVSFATGLTVAMEALLRWRHPQRGLVPPAQFIPLAEELRLVIPIGEWVLANACRQAREWQRGALPGIRIAVNLSALHFQNAGLPDTLAALLHEVGLDPGSLDLEITESAAMQNVEQTVATLAALRGLGVRISIDDFGTGQASLAYLQRLPIDCLKIDRDFVRDIANGRPAEAIVTAIVELAHGLGLTVIAEGVETEQQLAFLKLRGCDEYQGYLTSKPLPAAEIEHQFTGCSVPSLPPT
jgi:diguanylate cyclase (GGDEF)-like protein/PAS domain S-box-containing protein